MHCLCTNSRRNRHRLLTLVLLAGSAANLAADSFDPVRQKIRKAVERGKVPSITVAVSRGSEIVWEEAFGWANREKQIAATPRTPYSLASISKPFTATGLMILVERDKIRLDRPVNQYLGEAKLRPGIGNPAKATVRRVASHTAGLPLHYHFFPADEPLRRPAMEETIRRYAILMTKPGERYRYSNLGYGILDYVIERTSGKTYAAFLREEVFAPLGLGDTFVPTEPQAAAKAAVRYQNGTEPLPFYDFDHRGGSAVFSSAHDLVRFGMSHLGIRTQGARAILSRRSLARMKKPVGKLRDGSGYGIGWRVSRRRGVATIGHTGGMGGVTTSLLLIPSLEAAIVVLSNTRTPLVTKVSDQIAELLLSEKGSQQPEQKQREAGDSSPSKQRAPLPGRVAGFWEGLIATGERPMPLKLWLESSGPAEARIGDGPRAKLLRAAFERGYLQARLNGDIGTPEAGRKRHIIVLDLKLRGATLNGSATAVSIPGQKLPNALSYWAELKRAPR